MVGRAHPEPSPPRQGRATGLRNPTTPTLPASKGRLSEAFRAILRPGIFQGEYRLDDCKF